MTAQVQVFELWMQFGEYRNSHKWHKIRRAFVNPLPSCGYLWGGSGILVAWLVEINPKKKRKSLKRNKVMTEAFDFRQVEAETTCER